MNAIIVAINYSASADNAIKYAAALARHTNSTLFLLNSFEISVCASNTLLPASAIDEMLATNKKHLQEIALNTSTTFGIPVQCVNETSFLREALDYQVERLKAELVVVGMSECFPGHEHDNHAISIIRHAKYPVLAIPEEASFNGISKILFAFDPKCIDETNKLPMLMEVAAYFKAEVHVCHIEKDLVPASPDHSGNIPVNVEGLFGQVAHSYEDITDQNVINGIENGIKDFKPDLLVMIPHKYRFWDRLWHKSNTNKMALRAHIPLLALPNS